MSSGYWQIKRQTEQYPSGLPITQKVKEYVQRWESRCYPGGICDEVPAKVAKSGRAPSYKAIAMCILKNDLHLRGIGFDVEENDLCKDLRNEHNRKKSKQLNLF